MVAAVRAGDGGGDVGRGVRRAVRASRHRLRSRARTALDPRGARRAWCDRGVARAARGHAAVARPRGTRRVSGGWYRLDAVLDRSVRGRHAAGVRAFAREGGGPVEAGRRVLHHEWHHQPAAVRVRAGGAALRRLDGAAARRAMSDRAPLPIVMAITGASGAPYAVRLLEALLEVRQPVQLIVSDHGLRLLRTETDIGSIAELRARVGAD